MTLEYGGTKNFHCSQLLDSLFPRYKSLVGIEALVFRNSGGLDELALRDWADGASILLLFIEGNVFERSRIVFDRRLNR